MLMKVKMELSPFDDTDSTCKFCSDPSHTTGWCSWSVWPDGDIHPAEAETYKQTLQKALRIRKNCLNRELHLVSRGNFLRRLAVVLEIINGKDLDICVLLDFDGATALLSAMKKNNTDAALVLIAHGGKELILTPFTNEEYEGAMGFHLAVVNGNRRVMKAMLDALDPAERTTLIHTRVTGKYFICNLKYSTMPLSLGIWCGDNDVFRDLISYSADLDSRETANGDSILHTLVRSGVRDSAGAIEKLNIILNCEESMTWWCARRGLAPSCCSGFEKGKYKSYLLKMKNKDGYTALTLAAELALADIVLVILNTEGAYRFTDWVLGKQIKARFDMDEIEGSISNRRDHSFVDLIINSDDGLSDAKWNYTWFLFCSWFVYHLVVMVLYTLVAVNNPLAQNRTFHGNTTVYTTNQDYARLVCEVLITVTAAVYGILESIYLFRMTFIFLAAQCHRIFTGRSEYGNLTMRRPDAFRLVIRVFASSTLAWGWLRYRSEKQEDVPMSIGLITGWYFILFFTRASEVSAFFTVMIHRMLFGDLLRFMITFAALLVGFGSANMVLYMGSNDGLPASLASFDTTLLTMFRLLTGLSDLIVLDKARSPTAASLLYILFVCIATILLLNMLIAAMSDTYASVAEKKHLLFLKYRLMSILYLEDNLPCIFQTRWLATRYMHYNKHAQRWELDVDLTPGS